MNARWNERIARAGQLAAQHSSAASVLRFYLSLAAYQNLLLDRALDRHGSVFQAGAAPLTFRQALDVEHVIAELPGFLSWLSRNAPSRLAEAAATMNESTSEWQQLVQSYVAGQLASFDNADEILFVVEAVLQPLAEWFATEAAGTEAAPRFSPTVLECPACGGLPVLGVRHEEGYGARQTLLCGLCLTERPHRRILCPRCGEERFDALPVYGADQFGHIRVAACDTCRTYLKIIDMTRDGRAVPVVDDLASLALDLWARDQGYTRLRPNLLRF
jgi:FdhE protein